MVRSFIVSIDVSFDNNFSYWNDSARRIVELSKSVVCQHWIDSHLFFVFVTDHEKWDYGSSDIPVWKLTILIKSILKQCLWLHSIKSIFFVLFENRIFQGQNSCPNSVPYHVTNDNGMIFLSPYFVESLKSESWIFDYESGMDGWMFVSSSIHLHFMSKNQKK